MQTDLILIPLAFLTLTLAALYGGAEIGMYQVSRIRLRLGVEQKRLPFILLSRTLRDSAAMLISILIGTNITHFATTSIITYIFVQNIDNTNTAKIATTIVTGPLLFLFAEVIPKNIFFFRANTLMPYISPLMYASHKLFTWCGIAPFLTIITGLLGKLFDTRAPSRTTVRSLQRRQLAAILRETHEEGFLSPLQTEIMDRMAGISNITVELLMVPLNRLHMIELNSDSTALLQSLKTAGFTRLPVYEKYRTNIVGFVNVYEALGSGQKFNNLRPFLKSFHSLPCETLVAEAISFMKAHNCKILLAARAGRLTGRNPAGIVTMQDMVEELFGQVSNW